MVYASKTMSKSSAMVLSQRCIAESAYVEICPLPDGFYELTVKSDRKYLLNEDFILVKIGPGSGPVEFETITAFDFSSALSALGDQSEEVCFVGSHVKDAFVPAGCFECVHVDAESQTGFVIRREEDELGSYKVEEWINGGIVDHHYVSEYKSARFWISEHFVDHCSRRYALNDLCDLWNELADVPVNEDGVLIAQPFQFFPAGAHVKAIWRFFEDCNPLFLVGEAGRVIGPDHKYRSM